MVDVGAKPVTSREALARGEITMSAAALTLIRSGKVAKGETISGLVEMPKKLDLYEPFRLTLSGQTIEFRLNEDDLRDYGNR